MKGGIKRDNHITKRKILNETISEIHSIGAKFNVTPNIMKILVFALILFSIISCDGPYKNCPEHRFSQDFKDYNFYRENSYWIYYDSKFKVFDTITLKNQTLTFIDRCNYSSVPTEILTQKYKSSFYYRDSIITVHSVASIELFNSYHSIPFGIFSSYSSNQGYYIGYLDTLTVNSRQYKNIHIFKGDSYNEIYYWSKNIGIIRKKTPKKYNSDTLYNFDLVKYELK